MTKTDMRAYNSTLDEHRPTTRGTSALAIIVSLFALFAAQSAHSQNFTVLHTFTDSGDGAYPGDVVLDDRGNVFGGTSQGGSFGYGVVFKLDPVGKETVLHNFAGGDGLAAGQSLLRGTSGNLYSTTSQGGTPEGGGCRFGCGALFQLNEAGKETVLYAFEYPSFPGGLVRDESGNFFGISSEESEKYWGAVFEVNNTGKLTVLHQFTGRPDGGGPYGRLILDTQGNLYGTTYNGGGSCFCGVVFEIDEAGREKVLYAFSGGTDGAAPYGGLVRDNEGNLYGTTSLGGDMSDSCNRGLGCGTVFRLDKTGKKTLLYTFSGPDGSTPYTTLVRDSAGNLYGTTDIGGTSGACRGDGCGTVFKLDTNGKETVLHSFSGTDGNQPGDLFLDATGTLYGATGGGGDTARCGINYGGCGVIFKLIP